MKNISKKNAIIYGVLFALTLLLFTNFLTMHYATDTYNIINTGYTNYAINWSLTDGRIFMGIIGLLAGLVHMPITGYVIVLLIIAIRNIMFMCYDFKRIYSKFKGT